VKKRESPKTETARLRERAIERLATEKTSPPNARNRTEALEHELDTHKMELEMQNEELRAARIELEEGLDRYTQLFDFAPIGYATIVADGTVREVNHVGASLLGELRGRVIGRRFTLFLSPHHRSAFNGLLDEVLGGDVKRTLEVDLIRTVQERPCVRLTAVSVAAREPTALLAFEDVTMQKQAERRLHHADEMLREADRRKDEFLAVLSHELRTPLSSILMHAQLLQQGGIDESEARSSGDAIERAARMQVGLIDDLLDVSRIVAGKLSFRSERVSPGAVVQAAVDAVSNESRKKTIGVTMAIAPTASLLVGDASRLQQAVGNLLTNAVKFTPEHGRIHVTLDEIRGKVRIEVRDNGVGIDRASLPRLFERFWQADSSATRSSSGLGLGLSIVHSIVEAHGGTVHAESEGKGQGSTFTIFLPTASAPSEVVSGAPARAEFAKIHGARLLVVEDDEGTRATLKHVLKRAGADVRDAGNGAGAMKLLARFKPDVLVCDIAMPKEDGCALLRRIRAWEKKRGGHVQAVALTAFAGEERPHARCRIPRASRQAGRRPAAARDRVPAPRVLTI
jgi:PAS domain S-box-containing protein